MCVMNYLFKTKTGMNSSVVYTRLALALQSVTVSPKLRNSQAQVEKGEEGEGTGRGKREGDRRS